MKPLHILALLLSLLVAMRLAPVAARAAGKFRLENNLVRVGAISTGDPSTRKSSRIPGWFSPSHETCSMGGAEPNAGTQSRVQGAAGTIGAARGGRVGYSVFFSFISPVFVLAAAVWKTGGGVRTPGASGGGREVPTLPYSPCFFSPRTRRRRGR